MEVRRTLVTWRRVAACDAVASASRKHKQSGNEELSLFVQIAIAAQGDVVDVAKVSEEVSGRVMNLATWRRDDGATVLSCNERENKESGDDRKVEFRAQCARGPITC